MPTNNLEQFEAGHARHVAIGKDNIEDSPFDFDPRREPVVGRLRDPERCSLLHTHSRIASHYFKRRIKSSRNSDPHTKWRVGVFCDRVRTASEVTCAALEHTSLPEACVLYRMLDAVSDCIGSFRGQYCTAFRAVEALR